MEKRVLDVDMLASFFKQWSEISFEKEEVKKEIKVPEISALNHFFEEYKEVSKGILLQRQQGLMSNVWRAANLGRNEVRNSKTLRWFLDMYADHGQGKLFLEWFLKCLPEPWCSMPISNYRATEECCPLGNESERVDIEINAENFLLFIEVKIDATEGEKQLERYQNTAMAKSNRRPWGIIYLTKDGILPPDHCNKPEFAGLSWKTLANSWQNFSRKSLRANPNNRGIWLAEQFTYHISAF